MTTEDEINEIGEELDIGEIETNLANNVVPKSEELGESSKRNTHFIRLRYVPAGRTTHFSFGFIPRNIIIYEEIGLIPISQTRYILNIDGAQNREEIFIL